MKFLADENVGLEVVKSLRNSGFDIKSVIEINPGATDAQILSMANEKNRILITGDKDFGELVYFGKLAYSGVILLRLKKDSLQNKINVLHKLLHHHLDQLKGTFTVVDESRVRIRKTALP